MGADISYGRSAREANEGVSEELVSSGGADGEAMNPTKDSTWVSPSVILMRTFFSFQRPIPLRATLEPDKGKTMPTNGSATPTDLERFRPYLRLMARVHMSPRLREKVDPSDVVQDTLVKALKCLEKLRGRSESEQAAWLRTTLANTLASAARRWRYKKRDAKREVRLEQEVHDSSARLEAILAADQTSPSMAAARNEQLVRLATALDALSEAQQEAVILFHLRQLPLAEVARLMDRTLESVAGLIKRGLEKMRASLVPRESTESISSESQ